MDQANKALHGLYRKLRNISIPVDLQIKLFDALIAPILYGSAIWGFEKNGIVEKIHLQFCRNVLKVRTSTPCYMIYGEFDCQVKLNMVMFWNRLLHCENKHTV